MTTNKVTIIVAHYGLDRKITEQECMSALSPDTKTKVIFIDFEAGNAKLSELYDLSFDNLALSQQRKFVDILKPVLDAHPDASIAYFGFTPIPLSFHLGYLVGNTHPYIIYQFHHTKNEWYQETDKPSIDYQFSIKPLLLPNEIQKGKGDVSIRIATSFNIDRQATYEVVPNPENEFDLSLETPNVDSLFNQVHIGDVVNSFQEILNAYANKLSDREKIHLFIASSSGLPFALGTRINPNIYPYIQTYQFSRNETPKYKEAILVTKEVDNRVVLSEGDRILAKEIRDKWQEQLENTLKPFIKTISGRPTDNWLQMVCASDDEYNKVSKHFRHPWTSVTDINKTSLKHDRIDTETTDVEDGFEYIEKSNTWLLDDGFLFGLSKRLITKTDTDIMQAARLFFFHEALHYSKEGHRLTREVANGIGQFPKVIEEADYQADVWGLLTEYKYCSVYEGGRLKKGLKSFFCDAIETAVETMWSFVDTGNELNIIQVRSMNRFLNWYWQWVLIENIDGPGTLEEIVMILLDKPVIEFAGAQMELRGYRTYYKLNAKNYNNYQLAAFTRNKVFRFSPNLIQDITDGFKNLNGEKIKTGLKSFQVTIG
ncbi:SAVED domain-containing protein [Flavobacterium sp. JAS]|uniref:SAVED domain-containing protein n=1 Tax=Flavobacterium sp. JAS TaxID=2897329 RepID=UPI001E5DA260|nr:SAVED domain-containing protein [Flavobacterium sp. JAS]MCD0471824.1 SAVED domain-containing protein [Flavobacterium sp. JAS]